MPTSRIQMLFRLHMLYVRAGMFDIIIVIITMLYCVMLVLREVCDNVVMIAATCVMISCL